MATATILETNSNALAPIRELCKGCPFCGQPPNVSINSETSKIHISCHISASHSAFVIDTIEQAIARWNTRATLQIQPTRQESHGDSQGTQAGTSICIRNSHGGERLPGSSGGISGQDLPSRSEERKREFRRITNEISQRLARLADNYCADDRTSTGGD